MQILNTIEEDLPFVYWLFEQAIDYQRHKGYPVWIGYDKQTLMNDVAIGLQYKIVMDNHIACIFSVCYEDSIIWRDKEQGDAIYLHRIVVNPHMKGQKQFGRVLTWAVEHAIQKSKKYIRMDTWGHNPNIVDYYQSFGFRFIENFTTSDSPELPIQHRNLYLSLLQYDVPGSSSPQDY